MHMDEFIQLQKIALKNYERFEATLSEEQKKLFEEVLDNLFKLDGLSREAEKAAEKARPLPHYPSNTTE